MCIYIYVCIYDLLFGYLYTYVIMYAYICVCMCVCVYVYIYIYIHTYINPDISYVNAGAPVRGQRCCCGKLMQSGEP